MMTTLHRATRPALVTTTLVLALVAYLRLYQHDMLTHQHLGGEYFNIGRAIADGRDFSDPFGEHTGPTAWMPPGYPMLLAALIALFGSKAAVADVVQGLMIGAHVLTATAMFLLVERRCRYVSPWVPIAVYMLWLVLFPYWLLQFTSDVWIISFVVTLVGVLLVRQQPGEELRDGWAWGAAGGAAVLISPAAFIAWLCALALVRPKPGRSKKAWLCALLVGVAIATPWAVRNAVHFGRFMPVKSNVLYELYQANVIDDDGVYDTRTMNLHPYCNFRSRYEYAQEGEMGFMDRRGAIFFDWLRERPSDFARRILNRARAALLWYEPVLFPERQSWTLHAKRALYSMPVLLLTAACRAPGPTRPLLLRLGALWAAYLVPYIVIAFYVRYALPLVPLMVLASTLSLDRLLAAARNLPARSPRDAEVIPSGEQEADAL